MKATVNTRFLGEIEVDTADFTDEVNSYIFAYGWKQSLDDAGATKGRDGAQSRYNMLADGRVPSGGGGGSRLDAQATAIREVLADLFVAWGAKRAAAKKTAKEGKAGLTSEVRYRLAHKAKVAAATIDSGEVSDQVATIWPKVEAKAIRIVALRNETLAD